MYKDNSRAQGCDKDYESHARSHGGWLFIADQTTACRWNNEKREKCFGCGRNYSKKNDKLKTICLAGDIIPENGTAEVQTKEIILSFAEGGHLLDFWREETKLLYADDPDLNDLLLQIPEKKQLCVSRLLKVFYTSDTCAAARKGQRLFSETIIKMCRDMGITD